MDTNFVDKQTVIQADWLNDVNDFVYQGVVPTGGKVQITMDSIAELKQVDKNKYQRVFLFGYYSKGDGGGGTYYYDSTDVTSSDNGGTIIVASDGARWKLQEIQRISIRQFGAKGDGTTDDSAAIQRALNTQSPLYIPEGNFLVGTTLVADYQGINIEGTGNIKSVVSSGYVLDLGHAAAGSDLFDVSISGIRFDFSSGVSNCIRLRQCNLVLLTRNVFSGFTGYAIDLYGCDGTKITYNRIVGGSVRAAFEMDQLTIEKNEFQTATNHPAIEIYGGITVTIHQNFINWGQHEGILVGFDSVRGEFPYVLSIKYNYLERLCQNNTGSNNRPFIHVGKPVDQSGNPYAGALVSTWVSVEENYFNADVSNINLTNIIPITCEYALEVNWDNNRIVNFNSNNPRVKSPLKRFIMSTLEAVTDISTSGNASVQVWRYGTSRYKTHVVYIARVAIPTDGSGTGSFSASNLNTGLFGGFAATDIYITATPESDSRTHITGKTISSGTGVDGSDQISFVVQVRGGPVSSTVNVMVSAFIQIP